MFWDRHLAGFSVRVHATGRKTCVVQSRGSTGPNRVTLGLHGDHSADEARKQAAVIIDRIMCGEDPAPAVQVETVASMRPRHKAAENLDSRIPLRIHVKSAGLRGVRQFLCVRLARHGGTGISILLKSATETKSYRFSSAAGVFGISRALAPPRRASPASLLLFVPVRQTMMGSRATTSKRLPRLSILGDTLSASPKSTIST